jgi:type IV pilus assembly protein PilB
VDSRDFPNHLRPVPDSGDSTAPALDSQAGGTPGLTPPRQRGRHSGFVTDVLVDLSYVSDEVARAAIEASRTAGRPPERLMMEQGQITADQLSRAVAERYGLDHVDLSAYQVDMAAANLISVNTARRYRALPVGFVDKETLLVAMADPTNVLAVDDIQIATALDCRVAVAAEEDIEALIGRLNTLQSAVSEAVTEGEAEADEEAELAEVADMEVSAEDAPVIKLVYSILGQAVGEGASDVHFEPGEGEMRVRFRVDGVLREADGQRGRLAGEDHERPQHRREAGATGRPGWGDDRRPAGRPARHHPADPARRGGDDPHPRQGQRAALAR